MGILKNVFGKRLKDNLAQYDLEQLRLNRNSVDWEKVRKAERLIQEAKQSKY